LKKLGSKGVVGAGRRWRAILYSPKECCGNGKASRVWGEKKKKVEAGGRLGVFGGDAWKRKTLGTRQESDSN